MQFSVLSINLSSSSTSDQEELGRLTRQVLSVPSVLEAAGSISLTFHSAEGSIGLDIDASHGKAVLQQGLDGREMWMALNSGPMGEFVYGVFYASNGRMLATTSSDGKIRLWRTAETLPDRSGRLQFVLNESTRVLAFSPDSRLMLVPFCANGIGQGIRLLSLEDTPQFGNALSTLPGDSCNIDNLVTSPDGRLLAVASRWDASNSVKLLNSTNGDLYRLLVGHSRGVTSLAFSPDGRYLASGAVDNTILLWQVADGQLLQTLILEPPNAGQECEVTGLSFSTDSSSLVFSYCTIRAQLWRLAKGQQGLVTLLQTPHDDISTIFTLAIAPSGKTLALATNAGTYQIKLDDQKLIPAIERGRFEQYKESVDWVAYSPDGKVLASAYYSGIVRLWQLDKGSLVATLGAGE